MDSMTLYEETTHGIEEIKKDIESIQEDIEKTKKSIEFTTQDDRRDILKRLLAAQKKIEMLRMINLESQMITLATLREAFYKRMLADATLHLQPERGR